MLSLASWAALFGGGSVQDEQQCRAGVQDRRNDRDAETPCGCQGRLSDQTDPNEQVGQTDRTGRGSGTKAVTFRETVIFPVLVSAMILVLGLIWLPVPCDAVRARIVLPGLVAQYPVLVTAALLMLLIVVVCLWLRRMQAWITRRRQMRMLQYLDPVTGTASMSMFCREADLLRNEHPERRYVLVYLDIASFRLVNNHMGFQAGNQLLRTLARQMNRWRMSGEPCARLSGGHFVLLMNFSYWGGASRRLRSLKKEFAELCRSRKLDPAVRLVAGLYLIRSQEMPIHRCLDMANYARQCALKSRGRSFRFFSARMDSELRREESLCSRLDRAIRYNELVPYFQPKVNMQDGTIVGSEALVRWLHPREGLISPGEFIPLFEDNGCIDKVDFCIYEHVCRSLRHWLDKGLETPPVSCNFSGISFMQGDFVGRIVRTADRYGIPHELLQLELTETTLIGTPATLSARMTELNALGFSIAVDDFGSGYASLGQLQHVRPQVLKLDHSFIHYGLKTRQAHAVLSSVVALARSIGTDIVCEGVETRQQMQALTGIGCRIGQGYLYARPMPASDYEALLDAGAPLSAGA